MTASRGPVFLLTTTYMEVGNPQVDHKRRSGNLPDSDRRVDYRTGAHLEPLRWLRPLGRFASLSERAGVGLCQRAALLNL